MIKIEKTANCCGCTACASICNHNAITMQPDALGFLYPVVDENKCTDCGLCENVCAFNNNYDRSQNLPNQLLMPHDIKICMKWKPAVVVLLL